MATVSCTAGLLFFAVGQFASSAACASSAVLMPDGSSVLVTTYDGELVMWKQGAQKPAWRLKTQGFSMGAQSPMASLGLLRDGTIVAVERAGRILNIGDDGQVLSVQQPFYGYVRLKPDIAEVDWGNWGGQIDYVSTTRAAFMASDNQHLYLVPDEWSSVFKISVIDFLGQIREMVNLADTLTFQFKDHNMVVSQRAEDPAIKVDNWVTSSSFHPTALASCDGWSLVGSKEGYVEFIHEVADADKDRRLRMVNEQKDEDRDILDAGCLGDKLAYTVSVESSHGQIQLWDMARKVAVAWAGSDTGGHPGMAFTALPSRNSTRLLSLGDGDARLWNVENQKLALVAKYYLPTDREEQLFSAVSLDSGDFVVSDGRRLWRIPGSGGDKSLYAGGLPDK